MIIETKYNLGDTIYYLQDNEIKTVEVLDYYVKDSVYLVKPEEGDCFTMYANCIKEPEKIKDEIVQKIDDQIKELQSKKEEVINIISEELVEETVEEKQTEESIKENLEEF